MIPLSLPHLAGNEWKYVKDCLDTGWVSSAGAYVSQFERLVADFAQCEHGIACVNGTSGLHLTMHMHDVKLGDRLLVPNITFIASANAASYTFADPIFVDVDPDTWQWDLDLLEAFLTDECEQRADGYTYERGTDKPIKAAMPVHVLGNMCDMPRLIGLCEQFNLICIEDASESLGSYYEGKHSGGFGRMGVFSFNGNKTITTGGGGVIVTNDGALAARAKHLTTQAKADPNTYYHDEIGFNYRLVNVLAAIGVAQMEQLPDFLGAKKRMDTYYREHLAGVGDLRFQRIPDAVESNCWLFTLSSARQAELLRTFQANAIIARPFWMPMNQLPMFGHKRYVSTHDHSRRVHADSLSIPSSVNITEAQQAEVVRLLRSVF